MQDFLDELTGGLADMGRTVANGLPRFLGALVLLVAGWFIAKFIRKIVKRIFTNPTVDGMLEKAGIGGALKNAGYDGGTLIATIVYALLMLMVLIMAADAAGAESIVSLLDRLVAFLPRLIGAVVILVLASAIGGFLADLVRPLGESKEMPWLANVARGVLVAFGVMTALNFLGIGDTLRDAFNFIWGGAAVAFAIAFGVGGIDTAKLWWAKYLAPKE